MKPDVNGTPAWATRNTVRARASVGRGPAEAAERVEVGAPIALAGDEGDDAERAGDHHRVGEQVHERARHAEPAVGLPARWAAASTPTRMNPAWEIDE